MEASAIDSVIENNRHETFRGSFLRGKSTSTKASVKASMEATSNGSTVQTSGHFVDPSMTAAPMEPWTDTASREASGEGIEASTETRVKKASMGTAATPMCKTLEVL